MTDQTETTAPVFNAPPVVPKWPFFLGDALLLALALLIYWQEGHPPFGTKVGLAPWEGAVFTACLALGAWISILPFLLEHRTWSRLAELGHVDTAVKQIQNLDQLGRQIGSATSSWQAVQADAQKVMQSAEALQQRMSAEARAFAEFMAKANEGERQHLRLEVEKLRRAEADWLQITVRILDHIFALHRAAVRSGRVSLVEQFSHFQRACRDAAQRIGLVPFVVSGGEPFDPALHQPMKDPDPAQTDLKVGETVATGFRYQGQLVRKALVTLGEPAATESGEPVPADAVPAAVTSGSGQTEFTQKLADGLQDAGDTEFVRAVQEEMGGGGAGRTTDNSPMTG